MYTQTCEQSKVQIFPAKLFISLICWEGIAKVLILCRK